VCRNDIRENVKRIIYTGWGNIALGVYVQLIINSNLDINLT